MPQVWCLSPTSPNRIQKFLNLGLVLSIRYDSSTERTLPDSEKLAPIAISLSSKCQLAINSLKKRGREIQGSHSVTRSMCFYVTVGLRLCHVDNAVVSNLLGQNLAQNTCWAKLQAAFRVSTSPVFPLYIKIKNNLMFTNYTQIIVNGKIHANH